ncbi:uncharacterized protein [Dermacentor albipictus]|uniref:uncharacterized protein isoform X2 n=1 Tax=Dermacentor albipictus TaxID=60249 RepID=UPI0038FC4616
MPQAHQYPQWVRVIVVSKRDVSPVHESSAFLELIDASARYPTALFQGTWSDLRAFDACIETVPRDRNGGEVARGQYCNAYVKMANDTSFFDEVLPNFIIAHERSLKELPRSL